MHTWRVGCRREEKRREDAYLVSEVHSSGSQREALGERTDVRVRLVRTKVTCPRKKRDCTDVRVRIGQRCTAHEGTSAFLRGAHMIILRS